MVVFRVLSSTRRSIFLGWGHPDGGSTGSAKILVHFGRLPIRDRRKTGGVTSGCHHPLNPYRDRLRKNCKNRFVKGHCVRSNRSLLAAKDELWHNSGDPTDRRDRERLPLAPGREGTFHLLLWG